ncbi:MAG: hypothetical protein ABI723_16000 [Bacteroidia bacterium]
MFKKLFICLLLTTITVATLSAQAKKSTAKKPATVKAPTKCQLLIGDVAKSKVTVNEALAWCDSLPLYVKGDNGVKYKLKSFGINVIQKDPFLSQDYGIGEGGMPILARRAIEKLKEGDSVFLKNALYVDAQNQDQKLPNIVFAITGQ